MNDEKITVRATTSGQTLEVVVLNKRLDVIQVVLGEGVHSVKCDLTPTRNGLAFVGSVMGREIVYERSRDQVQADIDRVNPLLRQSSRKRSRVSLSPGIGMPICTSRKAAASFRATSWRVFSIENLAATAVN